MSFHIVICFLIATLYLCVMKSLILTSGTLMKLLFRNGIHQLARAVGFQTCILHLWLEVQFALFLQHSKNIKKYRQDIQIYNYLTNLRSVRALVKRIKALETRLFSSCLRGYIK